VNALAGRGVPGVRSTAGWRQEMEPRKRLWWTFAITSLALFAFALDRLVVTIALPAIRADLGGQVAGLEWTVNAYTLSFAVLLLTGGAPCSGPGAGSAGSVLRWARWRGAPWPAASAGAPSSG
jgi:hypothetical protein